MRTISNSKLVRWSAAMLIGLGSGASLAELPPGRIAEIAKERCETCHGQGGQGSNVLFPKLAGQNAGYLIQQMFNFKSGARTSLVMSTQLHDLSGGDISLLGDHYASLPLLPVPTSDKALADAGKRIYLQGNPTSRVTACATCHGTAARGGHLLPRLAGQHADYLERQLRRFIELTRTTDQTLMHSVARNMTGHEIRAVSYYLSGLN